MNLHQSSWFTESPPPWLWWMRFIMEAIKSVENFYWWYEMSGVTSNRAECNSVLSQRGRNIHLSLRLNLHCLSIFVSIISSLWIHKHFSTILYSRYQSGTNLQMLSIHTLNTIRRQDLLFSSLVSILRVSQNKAVSYWTRQRLIVSDEPSGSLHETTPSHTSLKPNTETDAGFPFAVAISFHFSFTESSVVKASPVVSGPNFISCLSEIDLFSWIGRMRRRFLDFHNQAILDLYCENF